MFNMIIDIITIALFIWVIIVTIIYIISKVIQFTRLPEVRYTDLLDLELATTDEQGNVWYVQPSELFRGIIAICPVLVKKKYIQIHNTRHIIDFTRFINSDNDFMFIDKKGNVSYPDGLVEADGFKHIRF